MVKPQRNHIFLFVNNSRGGWRDFLYQTEGEGLVVFLLMVMHLSMLNRKVHKFGIRLFLFGTCLEHVKLFSDGFNHIAELVSI